ECKIEKVELHQRRRIAEELDIDLRDGAQNLEPRSLHPGTHDSDRNTAQEAKRHQADRSEEAAEKARPIEGVIEDRELDPGGRMEHAEPVPDRLKVHHRPGEPRLARAARAL